MADNVRYGELAPEFAMTAAASQSPLPPASKPAVVCHADARRLLQAYTTDDVAERGYLAQMKDLCGQGVETLSRDHGEPGHFTASAFVLSPDESQLLLILHRKLQRWLQPGGHIEPTDTSVDGACRREVAEETGISALQPLSGASAGPTTGAVLGDAVTMESQTQLFDIDVHQIPAHRREPTHLHLDLRMAYRALSWDLLDTGEVEAVRWVPLNEVATLETDASVLRAVRRLLDRSGDRAHACGS